MLQVGGSRLSSGGGGGGGAAAHSSGGSSSSLSVAAAAARAPMRSPRSPRPSAGSGAGTRSTSVSGALRRAPRVELSDEQKRDIREAFDLFDAEKLGALEPHGVKVALRALGFEVGAEELRQIVRSLDRAGAGRVEFPEFVELLAAKIAKRDPEEELRKAFRLFDLDGSGKISLDNLRRVAEELGEHVDEDDLAAMIDEFDLAGDGCIDLSEFKTLMSHPV